MNKPANLILALCVMILAPAAAIAQLNTLPAELRGVGLNERLGESIPMELTLRNEAGDAVRLGSYFESGKPVILVPVYYGCPMLCGLILNGVNDAVEELQWTLGEDYHIVTFSFDPKETSTLALAKKNRYIKENSEDDIQNGWHFLTADSLTIETLTQSIGFSFKWSEESQEYLHTANIVFLSPTGRITRYLYGAQFSNIDMRNALFDAADGKIGTVIDRVVLYCYTYDPDSRSYVPTAVNIMKLGGLLTLILLGSLLGILWFREKSRKQKSTLATTA
jgi:protein SCO1/2